MPYFDYKLFKINKLKAFTYFAALYLLCGSFLNSHAAVSPDAGKKLFKQYCATCHATSLDKDMTGPALKDIDKKESEAWLIHWVHNNVEFRKSGDKDAVAIYEKFGKVEMPTFTDFTDDDIKSIIAFIKAPPAVAVADGSGAKGTETTSDYTPILWIVLVVFAMLVFLLARINSNLRRLVEAKEGEEVEPVFSITHFLKKKSTIAATLLILIFLSGYTTVVQTQKLGRSRDYSPEQPIHFSHRIHAGINQINCLYCHANAEKGKTASIPSVNICMNCHKTVQEGESPAGTAEIAKVVDAYKTNTPIKWVRIHNLPDHVYFNHAQHVKVGKIECQRCHGAIETEDQVYQFASLSMGWCINCHRDTKVQFASNNYYSMFEQLHKDLKDGKIDHVTEQMMGGTECQKCHY